MALSKIFGLFLLFTIVLIGNNCERLNEQIYSSIEGSAACFRRLNGTHQAGCSSSNNGAVGVVHMIADVSEAQWVVFNATAGPYVAVVSTSMFYNVVELFMANPDNVAGVLIYDNTTDHATSFTEDSRCPNEYSADNSSQCSSSQATAVWNERGTGLLRRNIPFPIFFLPQSRTEEVDKIQACYERFNLDKDNQKGRPLCSVQLSAFMFAAVNTEVCLRRSATSALLTPTKVCDPLGDQNVYYSLFPRTNTTESASKPVTLVTARIDTASLYDGVSPGAASSVVGMVTLITAAATLAQMVPANGSELYEQNVLWTLFNGESFDYIGSQRVAYDLNNGTWPPEAPLSPADIQLHVEIGQIGGYLRTHGNDTEWPLTAFASYDAASLADIADFLNVLSPIAKQYDIPITSSLSSTNLPPSSLHSFRRILKNLNNRVLPQLLLVDHNETFTNMFYNSALDDYDKIGFVYRNISIGNNGSFVSTEDLIANGTMKESDVQVKISRLANGLARTLFKRVFGRNYTEDIVTSAHLVDEMLYCFLRSQACRLVAAAEYAGGAGEGARPDESPAPLYVGVVTSPNTAPVLAGHLLALLTGARLPLNRTACDALHLPGYSHYWLRGWNHSGVCIQTTMNFSDAKSPAFLIPDYDMKSNMYSTWTESVWQGMWARVFVRASGAGARAAVAAGAVTTVLAALLTYWLQKHARTIFIAAAEVMDDAAASGILRTVNC